MKLKISKSPSLQLAPLKPSLKFMRFETICYILYIQFLYVYLSKLKVLSQFIYTSKLYKIIKKFKYEMKKHQLILLNYYTYKLKFSCTCIRLQTAIYIYLTHCTFKIQFC